MAELTIVVPTFRRHAILARALDALDRQTSAPERFEVIVVDDPAGDDPRAVADAIAAPSRRNRVRQLHVEVPDNVSAKRNLGWRTASTPLIMFIGDDILADPTLVAAHLEWHATHPDESLALLGNVRWADELPKTPFMRWLDRGIQFDFARMEPGEVGWGRLYTSNISLKRTLLERVDGFDETRFPFIYEDIELGSRLDRVGLRLIYEPAAGAQHLHRPSLDAWSSRMAAVALAERRWVELHPEAEAYFERLFRSAATQPPVREGALLRLAKRLGPDAPLLGERLWRHVDLYYRQRLAPSFLAAWDAAAGGASRPASQRPVVERSGSVFGPTASKGR